MVRMRLSAALLLLSGLLVAGATGSRAQQATAAPPAQDAQAPPPVPQPTFRGGIDFVRVDTFVTDKKGPVTDLKETDFEVIEDGKPQKIEQFKTIRIDGTTTLGEPIRQIRSPQDEELEAQREDVRLFVFFLDDYHTRDRNAIAVRDTLTKFIQTQLRPSDMLAIMYPLTPAEDVRFSRNHESIVTGIRNFMGVKYNYTPRNAFERDYYKMSTVDIERMRNQIVQGALEGLSIRLGGLRDGRKTVIFVSEGFTVTLPPEMRRYNSQMPQVASAQTSQEMEDDYEMKGQMELDLRMREVYRAANRFNTAFYSLDPRGLSGFEFDINEGPAGGVSSSSDRRMMRSTQDTLRGLSEETDGKAILNRNSLGDGLAQIVRDSSFYYLLGYTTQARSDGKFHEIKVKVKRSGVDVRARRGYWAYTPEMVTKMTAPKAPDVPKPVTQALASLASPVQAARYVRTWVGVEQGSGGKTKVTLVWEPLAAAPNVRREQAGRVSVLAASGTGDLVYRGRSPGDAPAAPPTGPQVSTAGTTSAPQRLSFEAPPGKLDLRLTIEAAGGGTLDTESRAVDVPDLTAPVAGISTPRVFRARSARDFQILVQDAAAVPVATREFSRTERLLVRFDAYGANGDKPVASAAILNRTGQKMSDVPVAPATAGGTHQIDLGLNTIANGDYVLAITVKGTNGDPVTELVGFRIGQ